MKYVRVGGAVALMAFAVATRADAVQTFSTNSAAICQPDQDHADFDFNTLGGLTNTSTGTRTAICPIETPTGLETSFSVDIAFRSPAQGTNCTLRAVSVEGTTTLASTSATWAGGNSPLHLGLSNLSNTAYKMVQVRCALVTGGTLASVKYSTF